MFVDDRSGTQFTKLRSYAMNCHMGWVDGSFGRPQGPVFHKESSILAPADTFVFMDLQPESVCWPFFGIQTDDAFFSVPATHHLGAASVSFADGHVAAKRWTDSRTARYPEEMAWHEHYYSSPGNPDLAWIKARAHRE